MEKVSTFLNRIIPLNLKNLDLWDRHWLFGEKVLPQTDGTTEHQKLRIRGWFPRQCAMEMYEEGDNIQKHNEHATKNGNDHMTATHCDLNRNGNAKKLN